MKKPGILALILLCSSLPLACYLVFTKYRCSDGDPLAAEQYRSNLPGISTRSTLETDPNVIAQQLVSLWLDRFTLDGTAREVRLQEYRIDNLTVLQPKEEGFLVRSSFSVKPVSCSYEEWLTGNGEEDGDWIRKKTLFFTVVKEGMTYRITEFGSSP